MILLSNIIEVSIWKLSQLSETSVWNMPLYFIVLRFQI